MDPMKHAYLIIAHDNIRILNILIEMLDDNRNDIYLLIDKKSKIKNEDITQCRYSILFKMKRVIDIRWGDYSQIKAELYLMKEAYRHSNYSYYHLLSGSDLPLKSQDYIHNFFSANNGREFIGFAQGADNKLDCYNKVMRYHFFTRHYRDAFSKIPFFSYGRYIFEKIINSIVKRTEDIPFRKGCNWFSITDHCCSYILSNECFIKRRFKLTKCADEIFLQTLVYNSAFYNRCFNVISEYEGCMREIDWNRGGPYVWNIQDKEQLCRSNKLFARKFSEKDMDIVLFLKEKISKS